jgi:hypothetical protein
MELHQIKRNQGEWEQYVQEYIATNLATYKKSPEKLVAMFARQFVLNFEAYLNQSHKESTLQGASMYEVLLEFYLEGRCLQKVLEEYVQPTEEGSGENIE